MLLVSIMKDDIVSQEQLVCGSFKRQVAEAVLSIAFSSNSLSKIVNPLDKIMIMHDVHVAYVP